MAPEKQGEVKGLLKDYVNNYIWMEFGFRFLDPNAKECWREIVEKAIANKLTVSCPVFSAKVYHYVENILLQQLRKKFSTITAKYRRKLESLISE